METIIKMFRDESEHPHLELHPDANLDFQDAASWYDSYGYHLATALAGDVTLQAIDYRWVPSDDATVLSAVLAEYPKMTMHEARLLLSKAQEVRRAADRIEELLQSAVDDYRSGNLQGVIDNLVAASDEEREHGDDPATASLAQQLLQPTGYVVMLCKDGSAMEYVGAAEILTEAYHLVALHEAGKLSSTPEYLWETARASGNPVPGCDYPEPHDAEPDATEGDYMLFRIRHG